MSLRIRLTALCVVLVGLVLTVFAISTFFVARTRIYASFDDSLTTQANVVIALLPPGGPGSELSPVTRSELDTQAATGALIQIRSGSGDVLYSSFQGSPNLLPHGEALPTKAFFGGKVAGQSLRLLYVPFSADGNSDGYLEVAKSSESTDEALTLIGGTLAGGGVLALLFTVLPAYFIVGRALQPIREVSKLARRIEQTSDFNHRLEREHSAKEMAELIDAFNELISRIEHTLKSHNEFLAESSHELRRPLTNLRTNLDILRDPDLPARDHDACIERMSREALAMSTLVGDLLLLSRDKSQALTFSDFDLSHLCAEAVTRAQFSYPSVTIRSRIEPGVVLHGDQERIDQALRNLIENAVNYSAPGATIVLSLQAIGTHAILSVQDSGYGIPQDEIGHVFDRFYRGEQARALHKQGVGLGLSIVKYVVEAHGGDVRVESPPHGGTTFTIELPLVSAKHPSGESLSPSLSAP